MSAEYPQSDEWRHSDKCFLKWPEAFRCTCGLDDYRRSLARVDEPKDWCRIHNRGIEGCGPECGPDLGGVVIPDSPIQKMAGPLRPKPTPRRR